MRRAAGSVGRSARSARGAAGGQVWGRGSGVSLAPTATDRLPASAAAATTTTTATP